MDFIGIRIFLSVSKYSLVYSKNYPSCGGQDDSADKSQ